MSPQAAGLKGSSTVIPLADKSIVLRETSVQPRIFAVATRSLSVTDDQEELASVYRTAFIRAGQGINGRGQRFARLSHGQLLGLAEFDLRVAASRT
jgi:hypothetical protein